MVRLRERDGRAPGGGSISRAIAYAFHTDRGNCALGRACDFPQAQHVEADAELYQAVLSRTDTSVKSRIQIAIINGIALRTDRVFNRGSIRIEPTRRDLRLARIAAERAVRTEHP